jgi:hypothetical protein
MADVIQGYDSLGRLVGAAADGDTLAISTGGFRPTYRYVAADYTPPTTSTDALVLAGASGKVIRVVKISVGGTATAASIYDLYLYKRTAANTGGTATNPNGISADSADPAASGVLSLYSVAPTVGTGSLFEGARVYLSAGSAPANAGALKEYVWGNHNDKAPTIRSGEYFAIGFNGQTVPAGASLYISIEWTEDVA